MYITSELSSPCKMIYALNSVIQASRDYALPDGNTLFTIKISCRNLSLVGLADRMARTLYGYYRKVEYNKFDNSYILFKDGDQGLHDTRIYIDGQYIVAELLSKKDIDESVYPF